MILIRFVGEREVRQVLYGLYPTLSFKNIHDLGQLNVSFKKSGLKTVVFMSAFELIQ